jgi:hypothetical protein
VPDNSVSCEHRKARRASVVVLHEQRATKRGEANS